jgi:hypothetical protein
MLAGVSNTREHILYLYLYPFDYTFSLSLIRFSSSFSNISHIKSMLYLEMRFYESVFCILSILSIGNIEMSLLAKSFVSNFKL